MADPSLAQIVGTRRRIFDGPPMYLFVTSNPLLGFYAGLDGVKTGFTDEAGRSLAASAQREGRRLVSVVLNSYRYRAGDHSAPRLGYGLRPQMVEVAEARDSLSCSKTRSPMLAAGRVSGRMGMAACCADTAPERARRCGWVSGSSLSGSGEQGQRGVVRSPTPPEIATGLQAPGSAFDGRDDASSRPKHRDRPSRALWLTRRPNPEDRSWCVRPCAIDAGSFLSTRGGTAHCRGTRRGERAAGYDVATLVDVCARRYRRGW